MRGMSGVPGADGGASRGVAPGAASGATPRDLAVVAALVPYLRPHLLRLLLALGLIVAAKLVAMLVPIALKRIVDQLAVETGPAVLPVGMLLAYGAARIGVTLFTELRQVVFARARARAARQVTLDVFRHLHGL